MKEFTHNHPLKQLEMYKNAIAKIAELEEALAKAKKPVKKKPAKKK